MNVNLKKSPFLTQKWCSVRASVTRYRCKVTENLSRRGKNSGIRDTGLSIPFENQIELQKVGGGLILKHDNPLGRFYKQTNSTQKVPCTQLLSTSFTNAAQSDAVLLRELNFWIIKRASVSSWDANLSEHKERCWYFSPTWHMAQSRSSPAIIAQSLSHTARTGRER